MFEIVAAILYFPSVLVNMIGLLFGFVFMLNLSSFSIITTAENFVFNRYSAITRRVHLPKHRTPRQFTPSISFMGGGQLWMFAIGVGHYVYENFDIDRIKFLASSSGCFAAVPLACGLDPYDWCRRDWSKCIDHFESRGILGCLYDTKHFYFDLWNAYLPEDAHVRCSGRLFISVTLFPSMKNKVISQFHSREELIWAIVGSICLPIVFIRDFPVKCSEEIGYVMDGGFSNDSPCLDSYTITVSALHRKADIKPCMKDANYYAHNKEEKKEAAHSSSAAPTVPAAAASSAGTDAKAGEDVTANTTEEGEEEAEEEQSVSEQDNLLLHPDAEAGTPRATSQCNLQDSAEPASSSAYEAAAMASAYKHSIRIRPIDIIRVPKYDRVWQIGSMGQDSASKCLDFERHEWASIRKVKA